MFGNAPADAGSKEVDILHAKVERNGERTFLTACGRTLPISRITFEPLFVSCESCKAKTN